MISVALPRVSVEGLSFWSECELILGRIPQQLPAMVGLM